LVYKFILSNKKVKTTTPALNDEITNCYNINKEKNTYIKISNTIDEKVNDILNVMTHYKSFKDWHANLAGVDFQENKAKYTYVKNIIKSSTTKEEVFELKNIRRKVFYFKSRILLILGNI